MMQKQDETRILIPEMSWLQKVAGISRSQKIQNADLRQYHH